jgi:hypothetical protein
VIGLYERTQRRRKVWTRRTPPSSSSALPPSQPLLTPPASQTTVASPSTSLRPTERPLHRLDSLEPSTTYTRFVVFLDAAVFPWRPSPKLLAVPSAHGFLVFLARTTSARSPALPRWCSRSRRPLVVLPFLEPARPSLRGVTAPCYLPALPPSSHSIAERVCRTEKPPTARSTCSPSSQCKSGFLFRALHTPLNLFIDVVYAR